MTQNILSTCKNNERLTGSFQYFKNLILQNSFPKFSIVYRDSINDQK